MNNSRIVRIRKATESGLGSDAWREGAKALVGKTLLTGSNLTLDDLTIPPEVMLVLSRGEFEFTTSSAFSEPLKDISKSAPKALRETSDLLFGRRSSESKAISTGIEALQGLIKLSVVGEAASSDKNLKLNPWFEGIKTWESSQVTLPPLNFEFAMGQFGLWNARTEVFAPVLGLLSLALPQEQNIVTAQGSFLTTASLIGKFIANSPEIAETNKYENLTDKVLEGTSNRLANVLLDEKSNFYHISIGEVTNFQYCAITGVSVVLSTDVDQYGYPIRAVVNLTLQGVVPPSIQTVGALNGLRFGPTGRGNV